VVFTHKKKSNPASGAKFHTCDIEVLVSISAVTETILRYSWISLVPTGEFRNGAMQ
jgi:hypothetical protein